MDSRINFSADMDVFGLHCKNAGENSSFQEIAKFISKSICKT